MPRPHHVRTHWGPNLWHSPLGASVSLPLRSPSTAPGAKLALTESAVSFLQPLPSLWLLETPEPFPGDAGVAQVWGFACGFLFNPLGRSPAFRSFYTWEGVRECYLVRFPGLQRDQD